MAAQEEIKALKIALAEKELEMHRMLPLRWRNPAKELPEDGETVWLMLQPHKDRGSLKDSAMSIEIVCGEVSIRNDLKQARVDNYDELGLGSISWILWEHEDVFSDYSDTYALAWLPLDEMIFPEWG